MNASSNPPPDGPARTVFDIGAPIAGPPPADGSSSRGRVIAWSLIALVVVLVIAVTSLTGLGGDEAAPRTEPAAAPQPPLSWNSPVEEPTADASDTTGQKVEADPSPAAKPRAAVGKAHKPAARPNPTPTAAVPTRDQGLVQAGTRCRDERRRGHTQDGTWLDCTRRHRGDQLRRQPPVSLQDAQEAWDAWARSHGEWGSGRDRYGRDRYGHDQYGRPDSNDPWPR